MRNKEIKKIRKKARVSSALEKNRIACEIYNYKGIDKLEYEIGVLKNTIKNSNYDLKIFPKNKLIKNKILFAENNLKKLEEKLRKMKNANKTDK